MSVAVAARAVSAGADITRARLTRARQEPGWTSPLAFAARVRARRRPSRRLLLGLLAAVAAVVVIAWVLLVSPLLALRDVRVTGTQRLDPAVVGGVVAAETGTTLARLDTAGLVERLEAMPLVDDADVLRSWPRAADVRVTERQPVAVLGGTGDTTVTLLDGEGRHLMDVTPAPVDLPRLSPGTERAGSRAIGAAVAVMQDLPPELRAQVETTEAKSADSVTLSLRSGATVVWGGADQSALKAEVLAVLLTRPADTYDVSAPRNPVTR